MSYTECPKRPSRRCTMVIGEEGVEYADPAGKVCDDCYYIDMGLCCVCGGKPCPESVARCKFEGGGSRKVMCVYHVNVYEGVRMELPALSMTWLYEKLCPYCGDKGAMHAHPAPMFACTPCYMSIIRNFPPPIDQVDVKGSTSAPVTAAATATAATSAAGHIIDQASAKGPVALDTMVTTLLDKSIALAGNFAVVHDAFLRATDLLEKERDALKAKLAKIKDLATP